MMRRLTSFLILFLFILCSSASFADDASLRIHFIDAGEGDSILIVTPKAEAVLIDAGNLISGYRVVEYLKRNDIKELGHLIFTHPHPNHIGGAFFILQMMKVNRIYDNGQDLRKASKTFDIYRWYLDLVREKNNYHVLKAGEGFSVDGVVFKVLWSYKPSSFLDFNANSLAIMVEYKNRRFLLTGDLTTPGERGLLKREKDLKSDLLKVGHHGYGSTSEEFLKAVSPKISIISVNKDNIRGYPSKEVLKRLEGAGSKIYRTDEHGDIVVNVTEAGEITVDMKR